MPTAPTGPATRAHRKTNLAARRLQNADPIPQGQRFLSGLSYDLKPPGVRLRSCGDVRYATALPPNVLQTIFAAQIQEAIDVPFPWTVTGVLDQRPSLRTTSHAKDGSPSLSGLTAFFDLAWTMVRFARRA